MKDVLLWAPLLWTLRILLLLTAGGATLVVGLYMARFLRPRHIRTLLTAELPAFSRVGGTAKVLGQELSLNAELDEHRDRQLAAAQERMDEIAAQVADLESAVRDLVDDLNDWNDADG
jgi:hypothetical protein